MISLKEAMQVVNNSLISDLQNKKKFTIKIGDVEVKTKPINDWHCVSITTGWRELYAFKDEEQWLDYIQNIHLKFRLDIDKYGYTQAQDFSCDNLNNNDDSLEEHKKDLIDGKILCMEFAGDETPCMRKFIKKDGDKLLEKTEHIYVAGERYENEIKQAILEEFVKHNNILEALKIDKK